MSTDPCAPGPGSPAFERLLDQAEAALERSKPQKALAFAEQALALNAASIDAMHLRAAALAAAGQFDAAYEAYARALEKAPDDLDLLHAAAELLVLDLCDDRDALEDALDLLARASRLASRHDDERRKVDFLLLTGIALDKLGESDRALPLLERAERMAPGDVEVVLEHGIALFELCRFEAAFEQFKKALSLDPDDAWAHHYLGLLAERRGDSRDARRHFDEARHLSPEEFPVPVDFSDQEFDTAVADALARLPERVRQYLQNVTIGVEELPLDEDLLAAAPPLSPTILGLFHGTPITERSLSDPWSHFPSSIVLYQRNLERFSRGRDELIEQIGVTLIHEVGHFLGLSEQDLYDRGLD